MRYVDEIIRRMEVINLENFDDKDETVIEDTYPWQMKTIKCRLGEMSLKILVIRYNIPRSITIHHASLKMSNTDPLKGFVRITWCILNFVVRLSFYPYIKRILYVVGLGASNK